MDYEFELPVTQYLEMPCVISKWNCHDGESLSQANGLRPSKRTDISILFGCEIRSFTSSRPISFREEWLPSSWKYGHATGLKVLPWFLTANNNELPCMIIYTACILVRIRWKYLDHSPKSVTISMTDKFLGKECNSIDIATECVNRELCNAIKGQIFIICFSIENYTRALRPGCPLVFRV